MAIFLTGSTGYIGAHVAANLLQGHDAGLNLLVRLNSEFRKTIVMVTHDPHAAERAHRVLHLDKGTLSGEAVAAR